MIRAGGLSPASARASIAPRLVASRIRPSWTPQGQLRCRAIDDERNRSAAVRSLVLGAAGDVNLRVPDKAGQRAADEGAGAIDEARSVVE